MAIKRKISLRHHEESIRRWASEGKDDAWIARALGTSPASIQSFRSRRRIPTEARRGRREATCRGLRKQLGVPVGGEPVGGERVALHAHPVEDGAGRLLARTPTREVRLGLGFGE